MTERSRPWQRTAALWALGVGGSLGCNAILGIDRAEPITPASCADDADCDDDNPCTEDQCNEGRCARTPRTGDSPAQTPGDCLALVCDAGELSAVFDDADPADDHRACTLDACAAGMPRSSFRPAGEPCAEAGGAVCDGVGACVECISNAQCAVPRTCGGGGEPGVCGCTPTPCASVGLTCGFHPDSGCGGPLDCNNQSTDGAETDIDCGGDVGACATRCAAGRACLEGSDCASGLCTLGSCAATAQGAGSAR